MIHDMWVARSHFVLFPFVDLDVPCSKMANAPSPANAYLAHLPQTRLPSLDFIYRLECSMSSDVQVVGKQSASSSSRIILPIAGGAVSGPRLSATILSVSGADWATSLPGESVSC